MNISSILNLAHPLQNSFGMEDNTYRAGANGEGEHEMTSRNERKPPFPEPAEKRNVPDICRQADQLFFQKLFHNQLGNDAQPCARKFPIKSQNNN